MFIVIAVAGSLSVIPPTPGALCTTANGRIPCSEAQLTKWGQLCVPRNRTNSGLWRCIMQEAGVTLKEAKGMVWEKKPEGH